MLTTQHCTALVCGSRRFQDKARLFRRLDQFLIHEILQGGAKGADALAAEYAESNGIPCRTFGADVKRYGSPAAFHIRNRAMLELCGFVVAFYDEPTPGTKSVMHEARRRLLPVFRG